MKKSAIFLLVLFGIIFSYSLFSAPLAAKAETAGGSGGVAGGGPATTLGGAQTLENPLGKNINSFEQVVNNVIKVALGLTGVFALLAFIYGGITWMLSMGDPGKVTKGKNMMIWAVFGLLVIFASYAILVTVFQALGVGGTTAIK